MSGAKPLPETPRFAASVSGAGVPQLPLQLPIPQIVFNGFGHGLTASEITSVLSFGPRALAMLVMPPVVAKTFAMSLLEIVGQYEAATGAAIGTIPELNERITAYNAEHPK